MKIRTKILSLGILPLIFAIIAVNTTVYWLNASRIETQQAELRAKLMTVDRHRGRQLAAPLPHHLACGSAPGGSRS